MHDNLIGGRPINCFVEKGTEHLRHSLGMI